MMRASAAYPSFAAGVRDSLPVVGGYVPACLTFGVVGTGMGLDPLSVFLLSALLYAGASQFVTVQLIGNGAIAAVIIGTVAMVNLRYAVLARALGQRSSGQRQHMALMGAFLTEEVYAIVAYGKRARSWQRVPVSYVLGVEILPYLVTLLCTAVGIAAGHEIPKEYLPALNTSLYALIIALVLPQIMNYRRVAKLCAVAAAVSIVVTAVAGDSVAVLMALLCGAVFLRVTRRVGTESAEARGNGRNV